ncbi:MAG: PspC domain-containing protein [Bacteroidaceae bacterium]|nr:PspC domain-containing protein [Bacteroidaceae bacterium]
MKKNITINLCGRLFSIDEDAYEMLATYEQSLRNYFRTREGGEEIAQDLEARIAELLDELKAQGVEAINIEHVREVIHRIGQPEEMEEHEQQPTPSPSLGRGDQTGNKQAEGNTPPRGGDGDGLPTTAKRLYRNPDDKKVLGVLSGFAAYFGGDVLWWRLGFVGLLMLMWMIPWVMPLSIIRFAFVGHSFVYEDGAFLNSLLLVFCYVVLAVLMPVAETPEDRLHMKGKEVNPQNLAEEVAKSSPTQPTQQPTPAPSLGRGYQTGSEQAVRNTPPLGGAGGGLSLSGCLGCIGGFFVALWTVISTLFRWSIYAFGVFIAVWCLFGIVCLLAVSLNPINFIHKFGYFWDSSEFAEIIPSITIPFYIFVVAALVVLAITAYAIIHSLLNEFRQMPSMPYRQRIALLVMWILGLVAAGATFGYTLPQFIDAENAFYKEEKRRQDAEYHERNMHNGIFVQPYEWDFLQERGWEILNAEGCNDRFTAYGEYMTGDRDVRYLDCYDGNHRQRYRVERTDTLQPGTYRITCAARANGTGACIYVIVGDLKPQFKEIPATGNTGGDIWVEADKFVHYHKDVPISSDSVAYGNKLCELREVNNHKGFGWNRITFEPIRVTVPTIIRYGLTSDDAFTGKTWLGQWFSATDFEVKRMEHN